MSTRQDDNELRDLQVDYLRDVLEKAELLRQHGAALGGRKQFKTSFPILLFISHQLKGSGGSLGFPRISDLAQQISISLNEYLEDDSAPRPTPQQLSESVVKFSRDLESEARGAQAGLQN